MRILCLTSRLPYPPDRGDRLRAFHFIEHLAQEHELTLVSFIASEAERAHVSRLRAYCQEVHVLPMSSRRSAISVAVNIWRQEPLQALYYQLGAMRRTIDNLVATRGFDAAYVHLFRMAPYVARHSQLYRIVDLTDVISNEIGLSLPYRSTVSRLIYRLEKGRIARYEQWVAQEFDETWLISEADRRALMSSCPDANIQVVPNGVDLDGFHPTGRPYAPNSLIFVGHLRVLHNMDAATFLAQDVLPLVRNHIPSCTLSIVGADPAPQIQQLGDSEAITVTGFVEDLNEHLNRAALFVAPLRFAAGIQNKVLEAMAAARPVITTSLVSNGLGAEAGMHLVVADDAQTTAQEIVRLLTNPQLAEQIGRAGRRFVEERYSWNHSLERVRHIEKSLQYPSPSKP